MSIYSYVDTWLSYGVRIAILYGIIWFVDLLDASILNVALPGIAQAFNVDATSAEWTIIGFLLALIIAIPLSKWLGKNFGMKKVFVLAQALYMISSVLCGCAFSLGQLILFRIIQGAAGGLLIPVGMTLLIESVPQSEWSSIASRMNMVTLIAPALGPLIAGYITEAFGWRWLFFIKMPLLLLCLILSYVWVRASVQSIVAVAFDWLGFFLLSGCLGSFFMAISEIGKSNLSATAIGLLFTIAALLGVAFVFVELRVKNPMLSLRIFRYRLFSIGNMIQCSANVIFLGATFITGLYLQEGLRFDMVVTGWILSAITPGMLLVMPLVSRYYNRVGPLPFVVPGLLLMSLSMFGLTMITPLTSAWLIAVLIFCEGAASGIIQTPNMLAIFAEVPASMKSDGSALYALGKQLSASIGVAFSTMILSVGMRYYGITYLLDAPLEQVLPLFHYVFYALAVIPLMTLTLCFFVDNKKALAAVQSSKV